MSKEINIVSYLKQHLKTHLIGCELHYLETTNSTNDVARELAEKGSPEGTAVIAGLQKAGRGRLGRTWFSSQGNLAISLILKPGIDRMRLLPAVSSLSVLHTLRKLGIKASIKWPNDVLIKGKKVCGILIESQLEAGTLKYSIVGIGINIKLDVFKYPEIAEIATSISAHTSRNIGINEVTLILLTELENLYTRIDDAHQIYNEWLDNMETIGKRIRVNTGKAIEEGTAETVNEEGNLVLQCDDGTFIEVIAGDVTLLKN
jgi:BirA family biotin operon repressor/biotin-[acetyl-CoA-carboxylase] ligase